MMATKSQTQEIQRISVMINTKTQINYTHTRHIIQTVEHKRPRENLGGKWKKNPTHINSRRKRITTVRNSVEPCN